MVVFLVLNSISVAPTVELFVPRELSSESLPRMKLLTSLPLWTGLSNELESELKYNGDNTDDRRLRIEEG